MNTTQRIIKNTLSLLTGNIIAGFLAFAALVYLARVLGPGDFGKINFATATIVYFTLIANLGLPLLGIREIARDREKTKDYLGNILALRLSLSGISLGLLILMAFLLKKPIEIKYLLVLYGLGVIPSALFLDWVFQGTEKMEYIALGQITSNALYFLLVSLLIRSTKQLLLIPCFQVASSLLITLLLMAIFVIKYGKIKFNFSLHLWKNLIRQSLPIGISLIMAQIFYNIDTVMLGFMRGSDEVGYYNAAYKIILLLIMVVGTYHEAVFPLISNYFETSLDSLRKLLSLTERIMLIIAVPLTVGGVVLARPVINLLYGREYGNAIAPLRILLWAVFIVCINTAYSRGVLACKKEKWFLAGVTAPAIVNLFFNFILIPPYGLKGAAIATVLAEATGFAIMYSGFKQVTLVPFLRYAWKPLLASLAMLVFLYGGINRWQGNILLLIISAIFVYGAFLYLIKGITKEDVRLFCHLLFKYDGGLREQI